MENEAFIGISDEGDGCMAVEVNEDATGTAGAADWGGGGW